MRYLAIYILFVYENYVKEDWSEVNKIGRLFLKPAWFIRSILAWSYSIFCFPLVLLHMYVENFIKKHPEIIEEIKI